MKIVQILLHIVYCAIESSIQVDLNNELEWRKENWKRKSKPFAQTMIEIHLNATVFVQSKQSSRNPFQAHTI